MKFSFFIAADVPCQLRLLLVSNLGMDMTTFFTISAKQAVREQRIPFAISMDVPNADTIRAIDDVRHGRNLSRSFSSVEELMEDLNAED